LIISVKISNNEILVRCIFKKDFKNKIIKKEKVNFSNFLLPYQGGVSIQRYLYCKENECKAIGKVIDDPNYVGFYIFKKETFDSLREKYKRESRPNFEAEIFATPLNEKGQYIGLPIYESELNLKGGNPAHSDLVYINPAPSENETPKTAMRSFVKKLFNKDNLIIDSNPQKKEYCEINFFEVV
jgi:hypothetical protein